MAGNTDNPVKRKEEDSLGVEKYINGLSSFIKVCDTPITIAIQGDWGSGKTSFMNMIREELSGGVLSIWFNTWQFSQFHMGDSLVLMLLNTLVDSLNVGDAVSEGAKQAIKKLGGIALNLGNSVVSNLTGVDIAESIKSGLETSNVIELVTSLKENFQKCVNNALAKRNADKLVIFIDDLDRLPPERAVEVLEVLKLFLDCDQCVFVLAIDYDVVCRGVSRKYGEDFDSKKGRSFFDKIIQVPFKMPTANYEVEKYIQKSLDSMGFLPENIKTYVDLISKSIGYNPRGMKRILNAFLLLKMVYGEEMLDTSAKQTMLFAVLCLQMSYDELYDYIVLNEDENVTPDLFSAILHQAEAESDLVSDFWDFAANSAGKDCASEDAKAFLTVFCGAIANAAGEITDAEFDAFSDIIRISGTTSSAHPVSSLGNGKSGKGVRYGNQFDAEFSFHSLGEKLEKTNAPTGWNGCRIESYRLLGQVYPASSFATLMVDVLATFYRTETEKFRHMRERSEDFGLNGLFYGGKAQRLAAPKSIPGTDIQIEAKNSNDAKIKFLRKILVAMGHQEQDLQLNIQLAHRVG